jgi:ribosome-binding protein aMBF1 (putative translation factor)
MGDKLSEATELGTALVRQLGMLAKQRREEIGLGRTAFAKEAEIDSEDEIRDFEFGKSLPSADTQRKLEKSLSWKMGVIEKVMETPDRAADTLRMEEVDAEDSIYLEAQTGGPSLASASNGDLLAEVARRGL